jgi:putative transposase
MNEDSSLSKLDLRNMITPEYTCSRIKWILNTPKEIREGAVFEAYKNRKACFTNLKNKNITNFKMKYLSKKKISWTINGIDSGIKKISNKVIELYPTYNIGRIKLKEEIPDEFQTCGIHYDGKFYYLLVPIEKQKTDIIHRKQCVATDPGVRTFNTFYDGDISYKVGEKANEIYYKDLLMLDKLILKKSKTNRKKKKQINNHIIKIKRRLKNKQDELQWKTSNWLCRKYNKILIPEFETKKMTEK